MNVLITGATGFIGKATVAELLLAGHKVFAITREDSYKDWSLNPNIHILNINIGKTSLPNLANLNIDTVIHLAFPLHTLNQEQNDDVINITRVVIDSMKKNNITRLIGVSSLSVLDYENISEYATINESICRHSKLTEISRYAKLKSIQEQMYEEFGKIQQHHVTIVRPGLVYATDQLSSAHAGIVKSFGCLLVDHNGEVPLVHVDSVARALTQLVNTTIPSNTSMHLLDDGLPLQYEYHQILSNEDSLVKKRIHISWKLFSKLSKVVYRIFSIFGLSQKLPEALLPSACAARFKPLRYSNQKAKSLIDWQPVLFNKSGR